MKFLRRFKSRRNVPVDLRSVGRDDSNCHSRSAAALYFYESLWGNNCKLYIAGLFRTFCFTRRLRLTGTLVYRLLRRRLASGYATAVYINVVLTEPLLVAWKSALTGGVSAIGRLAFQMEYTTLPSTRLQQVRHDCCYRRCNPGPLVDNSRDSAPAMESQEKNMREKIFAL